MEHQRLLAKIVLEFEDVMSRKEWHQNVFSKPDYKKLKNEILSRETCPKYLYDAVPSFGLIGNRDPLYIGFSYCCFTRPRPRHPTCPASRSTTVHNICCTAPGSTRTMPLPSTLPYACKHLHTGTSWSRKMATTQCLSILLGRYRMHQTHYRALHDVCVLPA